MFGVHEAISELFAGKDAIYLTNVVGRERDIAEELQQLVSKVSNLGSGILKDWIALQGEEQKALRVVIIPKQWFI